MFTFLLCKGSATSRAKSQWNKHGSDKDVCSKTNKKDQENCLYFNLYLSFRINSANVVLDSRCLYLALLQRTKLIFFPQTIKLCKIVDQTKVCFTNCEFDVWFSENVFASVLQVAMRCSVSSDNVKNVIIWGNHSSTQYPDVHHAKVNLNGAEVSAYDAVKNDAWLRGDFISVSAPPAGGKRRAKSGLHGVWRFCWFCRPCSSEALLSSRPGSCPAPCLRPKPSVTTWGTSGSARRRSAQNSGVTFSSTLTEKLMFWLTSSMI